MLVTLIQKLETDVRDSKVTIEDWFLPKEAVDTKTIDEAGRKVYTMFANTVSAVEATVKADVKKVKAKIKPAMSTTANDVSTEVKTVEADVKKVEADVAPAANTIVQNAEALGESVVEEVKKVEQDFLAKVEGLLHIKK